MRKISVLFILFVISCAPKQMSEHDKIVQKCTEAGHNNEELDSCISDAKELADKEYERQRKDNIKLAELREKEEIIAQKKAKQRLIKEDSAKCKEYGFRKGTNAFATCIMRIQETRQQEQQRQNEYAAQQQYQYEMQQRQQYQRQQAAQAAAMMGFLGAVQNTVQRNQAPAYIPPPPRKTECSTHYGTTTCYTDR